MSSNGSSQIAGSAVLTLVLVLCAACGSSADNGAAKSGTAPTTAAAKPPAGPRSNDAAYCKAALAIDTAPGPQIDFATASEAEVAAGLKAYAADTLGPLLDDIEAVAPAELADAVATYRKAIDQVAETGDASAFDDPAVDQAGASAHTYDLKTCGYEQVDTVATDYSFEGIAQDYEPGPVSFEVSNKGKELHEMVVLKVKDGVDQSASEILALPEAEASDLVETVGSMDPVAPGDSDYLVVDLHSGRYLATCFLPKGATSMDTMQSAEGEPHAALGMVQEFTVA